jgi:hypothetical protein
MFTQSTDQHGRRSTYAHDLGMLHERAGRAAEARRYFALVKQGPLVQRAACHRIKLAADQGEVASVARLAADYRTRYANDKRAHCIHKLDAYIAKSVDVARRRADAAAKRKAAAASADAGTPSPPQQERDDAKPDASPGADSKPDRPDSPATPDNE